MKLKDLDTELSAILAHIVEKEPEIEQIISELSDTYTLSAKNLLRYLILRTYDVSRYHDSLSDLGLSSLRTAEGYVYSNLFCIVKHVRLLQGKPYRKRKEIEIIGYQKSKKLIKTHANDLFNKKQKKQFTEIMVTLPLEAAHDKTIIRNMVKSGMEIARINLSHGTIAIWTKMIQHIHEVKQETKQEVKIFMDLSGPKIRTSQIEIRGKKGKVKNSITVRNGERIVLTKRLTLGKKSKFSKKNEQVQKAEIGVLLHEIIDDVQVNDVVLFDDGMIQSVVVSKSADEVEIEITNCYKTKLSSHKGINLPHTKLHLPALTDADIKHLPFVCEHANIVGYSFVRNQNDVKQLYSYLDTLGATDLGVVFKIENKEAVENLPFILLEGMRRNKIGVMIARGDLAVEIGFEKISEIQNHILLLCEAAHVPVIWATQVLDNLAKTGIPTRAEISDVAQGVQAECIMLNKGPYINEAIRTLKNILVQIEPHSFKKKNTLKPLDIALNAVGKLF